LPGSGDKLQPAGQVADAGLRSNGRSTETESERVQPDSIESQNPATSGSDRGAGVPLTEGELSCEQSRSESPAPTGYNPQSFIRRDTSDARSPSTGSQSQDLLRMGEQSFERNARSLEEQKSGPSREGIQPICRGNEEEGEQSHPPGSDVGTGERNTRHSPRRTSPRLRRHPFRGTKKKY